VPQTVLIQGQSDLPHPLFKVRHLLREICDGIFPEIYVFRCALVPLPWHNVYIG
jgi:hypothetical protein